MNSGNGPRPHWLEVGAKIKRLPSGRVCEVLALFETPDGKYGRALVKDLTRAHWVNFSTLALKWVALG